MRLPAEPSSWRPTSSWVIQVAGGEGSNAFVVKRVGRGGAGLDNIAFVKLELNLAGHIFLGLLDKSLFAIMQSSISLAS